MYLITWSENVYHCMHSSVSEYYSCKLNDSGLDKNRNSKASLNHESEKLPSFTCVTSLNKYNKTLYEEYGKGKLTFLLNDFQFSESFRGLQIRVLKQVQ